ncbi:hypothetical protein MLD38_006528 [Melastoma candidum]|uniref:Uncharacterized protein n=1 Tax=Melastoma candidum TaxID=119954 RepID=A0ACB9RN68_9MYRT|nr:hypothetical protein MLD38_006528 [Melastoma candidum]
MSDEFAKSVDAGLRLSKRLYFGKDRAVAPPKPPPPMDKSSALSSLSHLLPGSPMVYAVIPDPSIVDNPDIPSYQPHVHGRCDPPALIPLQMNGVGVSVDCYMDSAVVMVEGSWRVHCVMGSRACDCRIAVPMGGEQGSVLGVEVTISKKSYSTRIVAVEDKDIDKLARAEDGGLLKPHIFTLRVPQVDGGSNLSIKVSWLQTMPYCNGRFSLDVPFTFPEYVIPAGKKISKREKIEINVNSCTGSEILCKATSHPLKERRREVGKIGFFYEADVLSWSKTDINLSYSVSPSHILGNVILQSPLPHDSDQREMFCLYLLPGNQQGVKVFRREIIFVADISGSMRDRLLEDTKDAISAALNKLRPEDSFNIIAFNSEVYQYSTSTVLASQEAVEGAIEWMHSNFIVGSGTNILRPLNMALEMLSNCNGSVPMIFLVTDGSVEDERHICDVMKSRITSKGLTSPRLFTFGIGTFCNHHFLQMLALIGRGQYDGAVDVESLEPRMHNFFSRAMSINLASLSIDQSDDLYMEMFPSRIPDLSYELPLIIFGRYRGKFPSSLRITGTLPDSSNHELELKVHEDKDVPLYKVIARQGIDFLTAQAWFSEDKQLEDKVIELSTQTGVASEFTRMTLVETIAGKDAAELAGLSKAARNAKDSKAPKATVLRNLRVGFGDRAATADEIPPGYGQAKLPEAAEMFVKAASSCCGGIASRCCCCMCCISCCSRMNDQCVVVLTQLCVALACMGCLECCSEVCCSGHD